MCTSKVWTLHTLTCKMRQLLTSSSNCIGKTSIPVIWAVPNDTAWWQRHMCVNNLPRVVCKIVVKSGSKSTLVTSCCRRFSFFIIVRWCDRKSMQSQTGQVRQDQKECFRLEKLDAVANDVRHFVQNELLVVAASRDVVLGTCTRVQLEYRFQVLVLVLVLAGWVLVLVFDT